MRSGDFANFPELHERYARRLFSICYQFTRNRQDAEDQLQEILLKVIAKIDSFRGESSFDTWLTRLSINHLSNFLSRGKARTEALDESQLAAKPSDPVADIEQAQILRLSIVELPQGYRNVFILHEQLGYSHLEIAEILGISASTSRSQLSRARAILRGIIAKEFREAAP